MNAGKLLCLCALSATTTTWAGAPDADLVRGREMDVYDEVFKSAAWGSMLGTREVNLEVHYTLKGRCEDSVESVLRSHLTAALRGARLVVHPAPYSSPFPRICVVIAEGAITPAGNPDSYLTIYVSLIEQAEVPRNGYSAEAPTYRENWWFERPPGAPSSIGSTAKAPSPAVVRAFGVVVHRLVEAYTTARQFERDAAKNGVRPPQPTAHPRSSR